METRTLRVDPEDAGARLDAAAGALRDKLAKGGDAGRFSQGFVTASVPFCVGSMAIMGAMEAGIQGK